MNVIDTASLHTGLSAHRLLMREFDMQTRAGETKVNWTGICRVAVPGEVSVVKIRPDGLELWSRVAGGQLFLPSTIKSLGERRGRRGMHASFAVNSIQPLTSLEQPFAIGVMLRFTNKSDLS